MTTPRSGRVASRLATIAYLPGATLADADETALVQALLAGDPRAAREAWRRFGPLVRRIVLRTLGPQADVDDMTQDVFITFFDRVKTLRDPNSVTAFIVSITTFKLRHHLRWRWLRRWLVMPGDVEALDLRATQPNGDAREAVGRLFALLDRLSPLDRTAFTLRFIEELELTEVAKALDVSLATIKRRLTKTWQRMASLVREDPALVELLPALGSDAGVAPVTGREARE
jgi:RNA polymerase sigma-70 factor (ECF subfamily)